MDVSAVLEETFRKYTTCLTYSDKGYYCDNDSGSPTIQFTTHFKRPKAIRFEWFGETNITRRGFVPDASKSTVLCRDALGVCTYFDPRNKEEPELQFPNIINMLQEDSMQSASVTNLILPLLSSEFRIAPMLGQKTCRKIQKKDDHDGFAYCAERAYKQYFSNGATTFTDTIWIDENFQIRRFRRQAISLAKDKRANKLTKKIYERNPDGYERYLAKDDLYIDDYHFVAVSFNQDFDDALFCLDLGEQLTSPLNKI